MYQKYLVKLTSEDRLNLEKLIPSGSAPAWKLRRARILLNLIVVKAGQSEPMKQFVIRLMSIH
jgi:hypothetical protein